MRKKSELECVLNTPDVLAAVNDMCLVGKSTAMNCAGAKCCLRTVDCVLGKGKAIAVDVRYGKFTVSVKRQSQDTKYYNKDASAKKIDAAFDRSFGECIVKYGNPDTWYARRNEIEEFFLSRMQPLIGKRFIVTQTDKKSGTKGGLHSHSHKDGKATGGNSKMIQCRERREDIINNTITNGMRQHQEKKTAEE